MIHRILLADDNELYCSSLGKTLSQEGWRVTTTRDGGKAIKLLCGTSFDLAILGMSIAGYSGIEILQKVQKKRLQTDVVILSGKGSVELAVQAMKMGARDFLTKPGYEGEIVEAIRQLLDRRRPTQSVLASRLDVFAKEHASEASLSLKELCRHFRISAGYASRLFQGQVGTTFRQRLSYYRIEKAKHLLESTDMTMYQIAERCGFKNQRRFSETFRRQVGVSPKRYRQD